MPKPTLNEKERTLSLSVVTPDKIPLTFTCDSIHLTLKEEKAGENGGKYGIRYGHARAVLSLEKGTLEVFLQGKRLFFAACDGGFALVDGDRVTLVTEHCEEIKTGDDYADQK